MHLCQVCGGQSRVHVPDYVLRCDRCGALSSVLQMAVNDVEISRAVNEDHRSAALEPVRCENYEAIFEHLSIRGLKPGSSILDVGSAHGWFIDEASRRGYQVLGIEPDETMVRGYRGPNEMITGFFPDALPSGRMFDVITFNDVFEHLPDVRAALAACDSVLAPGGIVVINAPCRDGIFYRTAQVLARVGVQWPIDRLWQKGFPSPHVHYFAASDFTHLTKGSRFSVREQFPITSIRVEGLWRRLRYDSRMPSWKLVPVWLALRPLVPLIRLAPSDIIVTVLAHEVSN